MGIEVGSPSAWAGALVGITLGHTVSSSSMISRAHLKDPALGVIVGGGDTGLWLVSSHSGLLPDPQSLKQRGADEGGIPIEYAVPRLIKLTIAWSGTEERPAGSVDIPNPAVAVHPSGAAVAAVSLRVPASFAEKTRRGEGPTPLPLEELAGGALPGLGEQVTVVTLFGDDDGLWPVVRWARTASDLGFAGKDDAVALDLRLPRTGAGAPVFLLRDGEPTFCGLAEYLDDEIALLVPAERIVEMLG